MYTVTLIEPDIKVCVKCGIAKRYNAFGKHHSCIGGVDSRCKSCKHYSAARRAKERRATDPAFLERTRRQSRESHARHRNERNAKMRANSRDYKKNSVLKALYGITLDDFNAMLDAQGGVCAICHQHETRGNQHTGVTRLHVDHDHETGQVRALLCSQCNLGVGYFKENHEYLRSAIEYLEKYNQLISL